MSIALAPMNAQRKAARRITDWLRRRPDGDAIVAAASAPVAPQVDELAERRRRKQGGACCVYGAEFDHCPFHDGRRT